MSSDEYFESPEDEIGPAHYRPYGCCFGHCDTPFSIAFRAYHGLEEEHQAMLRQMEAERKYNSKKCSRKKPSKRGCKISNYEMLGILRGKENKLTKYMLPQYLRLQIFSKRRLKFSQQQIDRWKQEEAG